MENVRLVKKFRFEAAHRLAHGFCGKCANNHGHSWNGHVTVTTRNPELDKFGMVTDYSDIKAVIEPLIELLDHSTIVSSEDETFLQFLISEKQKVFMTIGNPTSEVIALKMFEHWHKLFAEKNLVLQEVVLEETCTTQCIVTQKSFPD